MFEITVCKLYSDKFAKSTASDKQVLVDHLEASAARHGFDVEFDDGDDAGSLWRDGREVGFWHIEAI